MSYRIILLCLFLFSSLPAPAQSQQLKVGDTIPNTQFTEMVKQRNQKNRLAQGASVPQLNAIFANGKPLTNTSLEGKVTLLVFWYPTCGCIDFHELDSINNTFKSNPKFQIIALGSDSVNLNYYKQSSYMPYPYAWVKDNVALRVLSFNNGYPSFMVVNPAGRIALMYSDLGIFNLNEVSDKLHKLLP